MQLRRIEARLKDIDAGEDLLPCGRINLLLVFADFRITDQQMAPVGNPGHAGCIGTPNGRLRPQICVANELQSICVDIAG